MPMTWLSVVKYMCHKWPPICSVCRNHYRGLSAFMSYHRFCNKSYTMGNTSKAGNAYPSGGLSSSLVLVGFVLLSLSLKERCLVHHCLSFCAVSFDNCIVCPLIYRFWLHLWYLVAMVLYLLLWFTTSDYTFGIFTLFLKHYSEI
jgi:hypothetical protein